MAEENSSYIDNLRLVKSLLIVTSLQEKKDAQAHTLINGYRKQLDWSHYPDLMIDETVWAYAVESLGYDPKFVFCHPDLLLDEPRASFYYRGLCALSIKAAKAYVGAIENLENGNKQARLLPAKALKMARTYNTFICSIIKNSTDWTLQNGRRTIIATLGITLDGVMRNRIGDIAEKRIRAMVVDWASEEKLLAKPLGKKVVDEIMGYAAVALRNDVTMQFSPEPDISFVRTTDEGNVLLATVEIKGGVDPAGALERYGAAKKSFEHALQTTPQCKNFFLSAVFTPELKRRIRDDRLVEKYFDIVQILEDEAVKKRFFEELFHYTLRLL